MKLRFGVALFLFLITVSRPVAAQQTRALWVTRWDYNSIADIERIMQFAFDAHFNTVLFQVRGNGTVTYPSKIELQSETFREHAWDPLQEAIERAHARGLQLHAWINVFPGWSGDEEPQNDQQLYLNRPDWFMVDVYGRKQELRNGYLFLSPTHPKVRQYVQLIVKEIYTTYQVDGIHFDYIRFPASTYSYDDVSVALFKRKYGVPPEQRPSAWRLWRENSITEFVEQVYKDIKIAKPDVIVSAAVIGDRHRARNTYFQNGTDWLGQGFVDVLYPMLYIDDNRIFQQELDEFVLNDHGRHIVPGISLTKENVAAKLEIVQDMDLPGVAIYAYSDFAKNANLVQTFKKTTETLWGGRTVPAALPWKLYIKDNVGPVFSQLQTIPSPLTAYTPFKIAVKISDPSGVYDDATGSDGQGIYAEYGTSWPPDSATATLSLIPKTDDWYITDQELPGQPAGAILQTRIYAHDNFFEGFNSPKRNPGQSDINHIPVLQPHSAFQYKGEIGPILWRPGAVAVDANCQIWVTTEKDGPIVVFDSTGTELDFSPIRFGMTGEYQSIALTGIVGFAPGPNNTMLVAGNTNPPTICRFNIDTGQALPGAFINFNQGQPDTIRAFSTDSTGTLFILQHSTARWFVLSPTGEPLKNMPYGDTDTRASDITVLRNGAMVFVVDRTADVVQCWHGATESTSSQYWRAPDFLSSTRGLGKMIVDKNDHIFFCNSQYGFIAEYDRTGTLLGHIFGQNENMSAPQSLAFSPDEKSLYVTEVIGDGPGRVKLWRKK